MEDATIRRADADDLDSLVRLRLAFLGDVRGTGPGAGVDDLQPASLTGSTPGAFVESTRAWLAEAIERDGARSWLAEVAGEAVGVTTVAVHEVPPLPEDLRTRDGYLLNVYVVPDARGRGIARALLHAAEADAPALGLRRLTLFATADGEPLYRSEGFRTDPRWMAKPVER